MALIGSINGINGIYGSALNRAGALTGADRPLAPIALPGASDTPAVQPSKGFGDVLENLVGAVHGKQQEAQALTRDVLIGKTDNLHQSMIAMQEAGVAFQLMVEVRNKVVESYQELMRMPV